MNFIESPKNPRVKQWKKLLTKKERTKTNTFMIEGFHLIEEALKVDGVVEELLVVEDITLPKSWDVNVPMTLLKRGIEKELTDTEQPQGVFAICRQLNQNVELEGTAYLLLDGVQDPGNIGTMIRTADAAGFDGVIMGEGTVDPYNPKVLRSAQGSHFHLPIVNKNLVEVVQELHDNGFDVFGTSLQNGVDYRDVLFPAKFALIMGNEGNGMQETLLHATTKNLYIPIFGKSESLNVAVAAGVLMYWGQQQKKI
ncbi:RNA methyltransferase [Bacillus coahuilensis m2-6]|uniref:TrmH family RNA methyltransferase n=1 Tax=Bacillus coahuilensis TaxID=408580 RepID=UPI000750348C|nr:RNA methyltransferase [Bacillus coahuilensis]KUP06798.1 RNA methyltransferase [Bacillus coahuilensis m2-6]